jgi:type II secretory pathway predicted ATPase ExeA
MAARHFGLRRRAFPSTPDHSCYYPATGHERALSRLLTGLEDGEGVLLLTGQPGTGKTLLCHCLLERLGSGVPSAFLTNAHLRGRAELLQALLYDLEMPFEGRGEQEMRLALTDRLLANFSAGQRTLLVLDEAHLLPADVLEELRLLGNLEAGPGKAVQVVLVGQPPLRDTLARPELASLRQRVAVRTCVDPLGVEEAADYLLHHLRVAGGRAERILGDEALVVLARNTQGIPRLLNQAGHQALTLAAEAGGAEVDVEAALEALSLLGLPAEAAGEGVMLVGQQPKDGSGDGAVLPLEAESAEDENCRLFVAPGRPA